MTLPLSERVSGIKQLQMMTKLSPIMYWTTCFLWDYFCYIIVVVLTLIAMYLFDTSRHIFTDFNELGTFTVYRIMIIKIPFQVYYKKSTKYNFYRYPSDVTTYLWMECYTLCLHV